MTASGHAMPPGEPDRAAGTAADRGESGAPPRHVRPPDHETEQVSPTAPRPPDHETERVEPPVPPADRPLAAVPGHHDATILESTGHHDATIIETVPGEASGLVDPALSSEAETIAPGFPVPESLARSAREMQRLADDEDSKATVVTAPPTGSSTDPTGELRPWANLRVTADGRLLDAAGARVGEHDREDAVRRGAFPLPYAAADIRGRVAHYDLLGELGRGGMGIVYKGFSLRLCRPVAVKVIRSGDRATVDVIIRFHNEAVLAARLNHPNIVQVFDSGEEDGRHYFVMEFVEGAPLSAWIPRLSDESEPEAAPLMDPERLLALGARVARALHYAHERGVLHRDVKPDNILIGDDGEPRIADFGLATEIVEARENRQGRIMGTLAYMPPEQANGEAENLGPASDVYALAATLYHGLAGRTLFPGGSVLETISRIMNAEPLRPSQVAREALDRDLPADLDVILMKGLEKQAHRRYPTCLAFAEDLEALLEHRPISARPVGRVERLQKLIHRHKPLVVALTIGASVLLTLLASFGAITVSLVGQSAAALRAKDVKDALTQAETVERAIRVNMLQGRADQARELVSRLQESDGEDTNSLQVVRTDGSVAYGDGATRDYVKSRLSRDDVRDWIKENYGGSDGFIRKVEELERMGFPTIDRLAEGQERKRVDLEFGRWLAHLRKGEVSSYTTEENGEPILVVFRPIKTTKECQVCHGTAPDVAEGPKSVPGYDYPDAVKDVRAVLVMKRSQRALVESISATRRTTLIAGLSTALAFLLLMVGAVRLLGLRLGERRFGTAPGAS